MSEIPPDDRGFTLGHGLFETLRWTGGAPEHWDAHVERLERGCRALSMPLPDRAALLDAAGQALADKGAPKQAAVRLTWTAGSGDRGLDPPEVMRPRLVATAALLGPPPNPAKLVTAQVRRNDRSPASRLKTLSYLDNVIARAEARAARADEALMLNTAGEIACAAAANVFWLRHDEVFTPDLACGVLDGVIRRQVIAACHNLGLPVHEVFANPGRITGAPMFLTNSLVGVRDVAMLDGRELPVSPLVTAIAKQVARAPK